MELFHFILDWALTIEFISAGVVYILRHIYAYVDTLELGMSSMAKVLLALARQIFFSIYNFHFEILKTLDF